MKVDSYREIVEDAGLHLVWFESFGAKSSCIAIEVGEEYILVDPGAAALQPSYPLPDNEKRVLRRRAVKRIVEYSRRSRIIIITHYHYDHHLRPHDPDLEGYTIYNGKTLYIKNPNEYINNSQWNRARLFIEELLKNHGLSLEKVVDKPYRRKYRDPLDELKYIHMRDYGDYVKRREELLRRGREWFRKLTKLWSSNPWIKDSIVLNNTRIYWAEGRRINVGDVRVRVGKPCFHGIEYDRTGWVLPVYIESKGYRILYTSDLMGPIIEDYAYMIIDWSPDIVIVDGPPTYLFPYMFNRINLERALDNMLLIIDSKPSLIIYDHHLLRDVRWRTYVKKVLDYAEKQGVPVLTASEIYGEKPLTDKLSTF